MDGWLNRRMDGEGWMYRYMKVKMDGWKEERMDRWVIGSVSEVKS